MDLLQALAHTEMPAGYIICNFPVAGTSGPVSIHMVTALGRKALRHFGNGAAAFARRR